MPGDDPLGASALGRPVEGWSFVLLEPNTEGRLAAALARRGEAPVALFVELPGGGPGSAEERLRRLGVRLEPARPSPFGEVARLVRPDHPSGPFLLLVERR